MTATAQNIQHNLSLSVTYSIHDAIILVLILRTILQELFVQFCWITAWRIPAPDAWQTMTIFIDLLYTNNMNINMHSLCGCNCIYKLAVLVHKAPNILALHDWLQLTTATIHHQLQSSDNCKRPSLEHIRVSTTVHLLTLVCKFEVFSFISVSLSWHWEISTSHWSSVVTVAGICNSVGGYVCFDMPPRCRCRWRWQIWVGVKARVVNRKQVDVAASRSFRLSWNALTAHCKGPQGMH